MRLRAAAGEYDGYLGGWVYSVKDLRSIFDSASVVPHGANVVFYDSAEVDALFDRLDGVERFDAMEPHLRALQQRIHEDQPYTFLYERKRLAAHRTRLDGVSIDAPADPLARLERFWLRSFAMPTLRNVCLGRITEKGHLYLRKDYFKFASPSEISKRRLGRGIDRVIEDEFGIGRKWVSMAWDVLEGRRE